MEKQTSRPSLACRALAAGTAGTAPVLSLFCLAIGLALLGSSPAVHATTDGLDGTTYDFVYVTEWGATDVGVTAARWRIAENQFFMSGEFNASGFVQLIAGFTGYVSITAERHKESWQGQQLVIASNWDSNTSLAETKWSEDGRIATTLADPDPDLDKVYPIDAKMRTDVTDPFSAMMTMLDRLDAGKPCSGVFQIYDGRRRAELSFSDLGSEELAADRGFAFAGKTQICGIVSRPLGGHRRNSRFTSDASPDHNKTKAYIARLGQDMMVPVRIEVDLFFGRIVTRLDMLRSRF